MGESRPEIYKTIIAHERIRKKIEEQIHGPISTRLLLIQHSINKFKRSLKEYNLVSEMKELQGIESAVLEVLEKSLRDISHQLYPSIISLGLSAGLGYLKGYYEKSIRISLHIDDRLIKLEQEKSGLLPQEDRLFIYRIAEEVLSNSVTHSGAKSISIELLLKVKRLHLYIKDNGRGFNLEEKKDGPGLLAMRNYARALRAPINIRSAPGAGTATHLSFSLSEYLG